MEIPLKPDNEAARLDTLHSLNILDSACEERFDRATRLARRLFDVPTAVITLVSRDNVVPKSCAGNAIQPVARDLSMCGHAILGDDILVVPDARDDPRFHDNPLVTGEPYWRFYAGCPLTLGDGHKLGTLCLIDTQPRAFGVEDRKLLRDLAAMVEQEMAALKLATMDQLTGLSNRRGFEVLAQQAMHVCNRLKTPASLLFFDLNHFKQINDTYGHAEGDRALLTFSELLRESLRNSDLIGRLGGDEFVALLLNSGQSETRIAVERLRQALEARNDRDQRGYRICFSVGQVDFDPARHASIDDMLAQGDMEMYRDKQAFKAQTRPH